MADIGLYRRLDRSVKAKLTLKKGKNTTGMSTLLLRGKVLPELSKQDIQTEKPEVQNQMRKGHN